MTIDIHQVKISVTDEYRIFINEEEKYYASKKIISLFPHITLVENGNEQTRLIIDKIPTWFSARYDIKLWDDTLLEYTTKSFWKSHYQCQAGNDLYDIYGHNDLKYSIYKNDKQVAWWTKNAVSLFKGDNYKIIADDNCNLELLIAFCLINDNKDSSGSDSTITFDLGNIGPQARKFNKEWQPNKSLS